MIVLALETSTELCGVCLLGDNGVKAERSIVEAHVHSEKLLTLVQQVLDDAKLEMKDVSALAVSIGPGSFTGLRIGLSSAKGFCYALGAPLVVVPTFDAIIESVRRAGSGAGKIAVALDAKQGEYYSGTFVSNGNGFASEGKVEVLTQARVNERLLAFKPELVVTDEPGMWEKELGTGVLVRDFSDYCSAESVARLALEKAKANEFADLASVEPMYLKDFVVKSAR